jgi:hypothetical protein
MDQGKLPDFELYDVINESTYIRRIVITSIVPVFTPVLVFSYFPGVDAPEIT